MYPPKTVSVIYLKTLASICLIIELCTSCNTVYIPTTQLPTGFKVKNDAVVSSGIGLAATNLKIAYTPINKIYISSALSSSSLLNIKPMRLSNNMGYEIGVGYYRQLNERTSLELESGYGRKKIALPSSSITQILYTSYPYSINGDYTKTYIQGFINWSEEKQRDQIGASLRVTHLNLNQRIKWYPTAPTEQHKNSQSMVFEAGMFTKYTIAKHFNIYATANLCFMTESQLFKDYHPFILRLGIEYHWMKLPSFKGSSK